MNTDIGAHRFKLGAFDCVALNDGDATYTAARYFAHAPQDQVQAKLAERRIEPERIPSPYTCLAVNTGRQWVLLDSGAGTYSKTTGNLPERLRSAGVDAADIDTVVVTHGHPDHLGGNVDAENRPAYPNARYVISRDEWAYWMDQMEPQQNRHAQFAHQQLLPIRRHLDLVESDAEVLPGIRLVPAPGHTPGQVAVHLASGNQQLLYVTDVILHELHLIQPDWYPVWDVDREQSGQTKRRLFDWAAADGLLVHAFHFPFPGLGYVKNRGNGWEWQPV
jgi:glyoxylase-like metal-dependent hydrolase (beta-lactamase superfamily II)